MKIETEVKRYPDLIRVLEWQKNTGREQKATIMLHQTHSVLRYTGLQLELRRPWWMMLLIDHAHQIEIEQFDWLSRMQ